MLLGRFGKMNNFWKNKKVLITGHTGFKGSWLSLYLNELGANVFGYALEPERSNDLYNIANVQEKVKSYIGDIRDLAYLEESIKEIKPDILFHLAAQPIVKKSYENPIETFETNIIGTANILEAARKSGSVKVIINVTSDKCYANQEWEWGYRELDALGGKDPYSSSKACAELITDAYRQSFLAEKKIAIATVRAGNVIGGGDWGEARIVPDIYRSIIENKPLLIRNEYAVRPWQHVLEPLTGYIRLAELVWENPSKFEGAWNFGPREDNVITVKKLIETIRVYSQFNVETNVELNTGFVESKLLKLDSSKANKYLKWNPVLNLKKTIEFLTSWYDTYVIGDKNIEEFTIQQIREYMRMKDEIL